VVTTSLQAKWRENSAVERSPGHRFFRPPFSTENFALGGKSRLGWTPSHIMIDLIVQPRCRRLKSRKDSPSAEDEDTFETMIEEALADVEYDSSIRKEVISVLGVLGLVAYASGEKGVPTNLLRELVAKRRLRERVWREAESILPEGL
jgi:hypothetical protein